MHELGICDALLKMVKSFGKNNDRPDKYADLFRIINITSESYL